ncbi:MAG TPA: choice-of-anchor tandem repeat NxxGxxAF-containing protein [Phycisphaerales bacterium]|nr:choice-of-anchor tandem repeat NxxGxxAF-containing protein [Phycisphaerales bacterium]
MSVRPHRSVHIALITLAAAASCASAQFTYTLIARSSATGTNNFNLPLNATLNDATPDINDAGLVSARVITDSINFVQGIFVGTAAQGSVIYRGPADVLVTDPAVNNAGRIVYGVQQSTGLRSYDNSTQTEGPYTFGSPGTNTWEGPRIASDGRTVYRATVGSARAIDLYNPATNTTTRLAAQNTLDPQSPFNFIFNPSISPNGTVAVKLQLGTSTSADEVWVYPPTGAPVRVAAETGAATPGLFTSIDNGVNVNDTGKVVIAGTLASDGVRGIYIVDGANAPVPVALQTIYTIQFFTPDINNAGDVVFRAQAGSTQGIFVGDGTADPQLVALVTQSVTTDLGETTFTGFLQNPRINDNGSIVFGATLQTGGRGIFVASLPTAGCDDIDFNNNNVFPEDQDVIDFFNVLAGADCPACNDIDFNNNNVFPEDQDVIDFFNVLAGSECA